MAIRRLMMMGLTNYIRSLIAEFRSQVNSNGGIFEAEDCMYTELDEINKQELLGSATHVYTSNSYADGETFQLRPSITNTPIRNLLWNTGVFNTVTSTNNAVSYGPTTLSTDPFGGTYSTLIAETTANSPHSVTSRIFPYTRANTNYTFSVYLKKGNGATAPNIIQLFILGSGFAVAGFANFNILTGTIVRIGSAAVSASITDAGNGWWRCSITQIPNAGVEGSVATVAFTNNVDVTSRAASYVGQTTSNVFAYGMQVEEGTSVTSYQDITHPLLLNNAGGVVRLGTLATKLNSDKTVGFAGYNLFRGSSAPESPLLVVTRATTQANVAQAPDGTMTAYKIVEDTSNGSHVIGGDVLNLRKPDTTATFTVYMKAAERTFGFIQFSDNPRFPTARINLTNGTISSIGSGITLYSEDVGNGWYKYVATATRLSSINIATSNFVFGPMLNSAAISYTGDGTSGILVWQPQAVLGTTPKPSLPSTLNFFPKISYNDFDGYNDLNTCPNLNLEVALSNLCPLSEDFNRGGNLVLQSQDFTQAVWNKGGATIVSSTRVAPDGTSTGTELSDVGASSTPSAMLQNNIVATSTNVVYSIYTKAVSLTTDGKRTFLLRNGTTLTNFDVLQFDYSSTGNLGNGWFSEDVGNGWFRLSYTRTTGISIGDILLIYYGRGTAAAAGATDIWQVWGAQVEPNERLTDYTLTTTAIALGATTNNMTVTSRTEPSPNPDYLADTLSATSNNALLRKFGTPTPSAARRIFSIYLKRKTGVGTVTVSAGGAGVVANLSTSEWTRVYHAGVTLAGNFTATSGAFTVTFTVNHGLSTGDPIYFDGPGTTDFSVAAITVVNPTTITFRSGTTTSSGICAVYPNVGIVNLSTAGDEVYAWGAQLELLQNFLNVLPTSYMPAFGTTAISRAQEVFYLNIPATVNKTVYVEFKKIGGNNNTTTFPLFFLGDNLGPTFANNYVGVNGTTSITMVKRVNAASTTFANPLSSYGFITNKYNKFAFVFNGTNVDIWIDGVLQTTTSFSTPQLVRYFTFLGITGIVSLKSIYSWERVLTPTQLSQLTYSPMFPNGTTELTQVVGRAFASSLTLPSNSTLQALDTFIATLITSGIWNKMDAIYNFAYNNTAVSAFSRLNLKSTFYSLGVNGTMTYQANGYLAGAGNSYLSGYTPGTNNVQYQVESFSRTHILYQSASGAAIDQNTINGANDAFFNSNTNAHRAMSNVNLPQSVDMSGTGLKSIMRNSFNSVSLYNQSTGTTLTQNRSGNYGASQQFFPFGNGLGVGFSCFGAPLTQTDIDTIRTAYNTYLSAIGLTPFA